MIGVVIPAHDEASQIRVAVAAVQCAARHPGLGGELVEIVVVADACTDATAALARGMGVHTMDLCHRNVGMARAAGADLMLRRGARWLALTDADSIVADGWLSAQLALGCEAVCGCVAVRDWSAHGTQAAQLASAFASHYQFRDGHPHIHGANMGVSADAYRRAGGFAPLRTSEDVALVDALQAAGVEVCFSAAPLVWTSARLDHRAPLGFGQALRNMSETLRRPVGLSAAG